MFDVARAEQSTKKVMTENRINSHVLIDVSFIWIYFPRNAE